MTFYNTKKLAYLDLSNFKTDDLKEYTDAFKNINSGENVTVVTNKTRWEKFPNIFPENVIVKEPETESSFE